MIQQARIHTIKKLPIEQQRAEYGVRVLTTRKWLQGVSKSDIDIWLPDAAPSLALLRAWRAQEITWEVFVGRYKEEQAKYKECSPVHYIDGARSTIPERAMMAPAVYLASLARDQRVTVLCWEQGEQCHRHTLAELVQAER